MKSYCFFIYPPEIQRFMFVLCGRRFFFISLTLYIPFYQGGWYLKMTVWALRWHHFCFGLTLSNFSLSNNVFFPPWSLGGMHGWGQSVPITVILWKTRVHSWIHTRVFTPFSPSCRLGKKAKPFCDRSPKSESRGRQPQPTCPIPVSLAPSPTITPLSGECPLLTSLLSPPNMYTSAKAPESASVPFLFTLWFFWTLDWSHGMHT